MIHAQKRKQSITFLGKEVKFSSVGKLQWQSYMAF